jgi:hypothetical protein
METTTGTFTGPTWKCIDPWPRWFYAKNIPLHRALASSTVNFTYPAKGRCF